MNYTIVSYNGYIIEVEMEGDVGCKAIILKDDVIVTTSKGYITPENAIITAKKWIDGGLLANE